MALIRRVQRAFPALGRMLFVLALSQLPAAATAVEPGPARPPVTAERHARGLDIHFGAVDLRSYAVRDTVAALQAAYEDYRRLFGLSRPVYVYILSGREFGRMCPLFIANCHRLGGVTVGDTIYISAERATSWLARHELFHTVWTTGDPRYRWLSEGLAVWFEDAPDYGWQEGLSPAAVAAKALGARPVNVYRWRQDSLELSSYYEQANLRVEFLANLYGRERIFRLVRLLAAGRDVPGAFRACFGFPVDRLDDVLLAFAAPRTA